MSSLQRTPPEQTAEILQAVAHDDGPVTIPGALDRHAGAGSDPIPADQRSSVKGRTHAISDANRIQYELEGGGAPSQRLPMSERTPLARFGHWLFRRLTHS